MISIDKKTLDYWMEKSIVDVSMYFYKSGCAGTKLHVEMGRNQDCKKMIVQNNLNIHVKEDEYTLFDESRITHVGEKWLFKSTKIHSHCSCGSSFSLNPVSDLERKIEKLKKALHQKPQK